MRARPALLPHDRCCCPPSDNILSCFVVKVKIQPAHQVGKYGGMFVLAISRFIQLITSVL